MLPELGNKYQCQVDSQNSNLSCQLLLRCPVLSTYIYFHIYPRWLLEISSNSKYLINNYQYFKKLNIAHCVTI